jgi:hypothetical protein
MSLISRAIPGLFGGVSQAIPAMRHATQGELQENALSTVVAGLFKRPGSRHIAQLPQKWAAGTAESVLGNVHCHVMDRGAGARWQMMFGPSGITVVNMETGATEPVNYQDAGGTTTYGGPPAYLTAADPQTAYKAITVADTVFIVNSEKTVGTVNTDTGVDAALTGFIYMRTAAPQHTYTVTVNGKVASHTSPATGVTVQTVVAALVTALQGQGVTAVATATQGLFYVQPGAPITQLDVTDTYGNTTMVALTPVSTKTVPSFSHLPPTMYTNFRMTIGGGEAGADIDPYYVVWDGKQYVESRKHNITTGFNEATMPYKMFRSGGQWWVRPCPWASRLVGDDDTNPMPSFVGRQIRDIFFYRNRLGFLAGDALCLSRAGDYYNFFGKTAKAVLDTDPIDLSGSAESVERLDYAVPFNEQLIVWATNKQQFSLSGDASMLSPNTARLVPTTAFESVNTAKPRALGNRIVFPSTLNGYTQLSLFRVSQDTVSNTAESIADHVPTYVPMNPRSIELSPTAKLLAVVPSGKGNELSVFKYEDDGEKLTQRAWQRFTFGGGILKVHFAEQLMYVTTLYRNATVFGESVLCLEVIDFSPNATDSGLSFGVRLDRKVFVNGATPNGQFQQATLQVPLPNSDDLVVYRYANGSDPVKLEVVAASIGDVGGKVMLNVTVKTPVTTGTFMVGRKFAMRYTFTEVFMRDQDGVPLMDARLKLLKMLLRYVATGYFKVKVKTKAGGNYEYPFAGQGVGIAGQLLGAQPVLVSGDFAIPVHAQAQGTVITIESDSHLPCCFPYAEWRGSLNPKSQR